MSSADIGPKMNPCLRSRHEASTAIDEGIKAQVTEFMAGKSHPGKDRKVGAFGFAGHNDPVEFTSIAIKKL